MKTTLFKNLKSPNVMDEQDIYIVLDQIKSNPNQERISVARNVGKGHDLYEKIKSTEPTFTPNAVFKGKRSYKTIKSLTNLMYLDFDQKINPTLFQSIPFVLASWKSFGGNGHAALIAVKGLTIDNFTSTWYYLSGYFKQLNLTVDPQTKDITRQNVISFDPDLYLNTNCTELDVTQILTGYTTSTFNHTNIYSASTLTQYCNSNYTSDSTLTGTIKIKYKTTLEDYNGKEFIVIKEGKEYRNAYLPRVIPDGERHRLLSKYAFSIRFNNPSITLNDLELVLLKANKFHCVPKLNKHEIHQLAEWVYGFNPKSIQAKKKKIWINHEAHLNTHQKRVIVGQQVGILRKEQTLSKLIELYLTLEKTTNHVTQKLLEKNSTVKIRTIKKYWSEIKDGAFHEEKKRRGHM